jgi:hypothetical protein
MDSLKDIFRRMRLAAIGVLGAILLLAGCAAFQSEPEKPQSVGDWMRSTKQIHVAGDEKAVNNR